MVSTEYELHPLGRKLMIAFLVLIFIFYFAIAQVWLFPFNFLLGLFSSFVIQPSFFIRGAGGLFLSIVTVALILRYFYDKISWYRFEFDGKRNFALYYKSSLYKSYKKLKFSLRETMIEYLDNLLWIVSIEGERRISILLRPPEELDDEVFYEDFELVIDENYYRVKKKLELIDFSEFTYHYMFTNGKIKKFTPREFELLTGLTKFYREEKSRSKGKEVEYIEEKKPDIKQKTDYSEIVQIIDNADNVEEII